MLTWALVNVVLSGLALAFALVNSGAPHRLRFHVCFAAMLAWLVPWSRLPAWMPDLLSLDLWRVEQRLIASSAEATAFPLIIVDTRSVPLANELTVLHLPLLMLSALLLSGLGLFAWQLASHHWRLHRLLKTAQDGTSLWRDAGIDSAIPILLQTEIKGAFSSGLLKPKIWVHSGLTRAAQLPTLLHHELTHIQQYDNWYLLAITLVEKLFWWNPLVRVLNHHTRHLQELSCDERCRASNADYAAHLAALMLADIGISRSRAQEPLLLSANIFNKSKVNIQRLKVLQRSHRMKPRHIVSSIATAALAIVSVGLVTAQSAPQPVETDRVIMVNHAGTVTAVGAATRQWEGQAFDPATAFPGENQGMAFAMQSLNGTDQFMKVERHNEETLVTFSFTDAALPFVLGPLADMLGERMPALALGIRGTPVPVLGERIEVRRLEGGVPAAQTAGGDVMFSTSAGAAQTFEFKTGNGEVMHAVAAEPVQFALIRRAEAGSTDLPLSPNLVLEADNASERQVTVSGEKMSIDDAIAAIATAANCNVFKDGETIVVDWCGAQ